MALSDREKQELLRMVLNQSRRSSKKSDPKSSPKSNYGETTLGQNILSRGPIGAFLESKEKQQQGNADRVYLSREYATKLKEMQKNKELDRGIYRWKDEEWFTHDLDTFEGTNKHENLIKDAVFSEYYDGTTQFIDDYVTAKMRKEYQEGIKADEKFARDEERKRKRKERRQKAWAGAKKTGSTLFNVARDLGKKGYESSRDQFRKKWSDYKEGRSQKQAEDIPEKRFVPETDDLSSEQFWKDFRRWNESRSRKDFK